MPRQHYRTTSVNMNELMHIIMSLQIMFGSRRGAGAFLALLLMCGIGYLAFVFFMNPAGALEKADRMWDRDQHVEAIREYKSLLRKRDPIQPEYALLPREDRPRLFRRIISHEVAYANPAEARDWISEAYKEGIDFKESSFQRPEVWEMWQEVTADLKGKGVQRNLLDEFLDRGL